MTLRFLLIRHGQSVANLEPRKLQSLAFHSPLTELGRLSSQQLGREPQLKNLDLFPLTLCSPSRRTKETAYHVLKELGYKGKVVLDEQLLEQNWGDYEEKDIAEIWTTETKKQIQKDHIFWKPPNGESVRETTVRAFKALQSMCSTCAFWEGKEHRETTSDVILVFTHSIVIRGLVQLLMPLDPKQFDEIPCSNNSITELIYNVKSSTWQVGPVNQRYMLGLTMSWKLQRPLIVDSIFTVDKKENQNEIIDQGPDKQSM